MNFTFQNSPNTLAGKDGEMDTEPANNEKWNEHPELKSGGKMRTYFDGILWCIEMNGHLVWIGKDKPEFTLKEVWLMYCQLIKAPK